MNLYSFGIAALIALPLAAQTATAPAVPAAANAGFKVAVIQFQDAVLATQEGQQATASLKARFDPRKAALEKKQADLTALQERLQKGAATMSHEAQAKVQTDLANGNRVLNRDVTDLNAEVQEEEDSLMQSIAPKIGDVIQKYALTHGFSVVLDVSSQQTPVLWAAPAANITADIVKDYDAAHPVKKAAAAPPPQERQSNR